MSAPPPSTVHIHPTAELAPRVLLPGDPGRALLLAQELLDGPRMFNHNRGLWGYTGTAADGEPLTIQSTGMGGPSAAIVFEELCDLGVTRAIRIGTCGALTDEHALGDLVVVGAALCADGTSRALGADDRVTPDETLTAALGTATGAPARLTVSTDLFYDRDPARSADWIAHGACAVEMEAATLLRLGELREVAVACVLTVSDVLDGPDRVRIEKDALHDAVLRLGAAGTAGLGIPARAGAPARGLVDPELERDKARRARAADRADTPS